MKKIILLACVAFAFTQGNAQIVTDAGTFTKPVKNTTIIEVVVTPDLSGGGIFSLPSLNSDLGLLGVKGRRFVSDKKAYRATANVAISDSGVSGEDTEAAVGLAFGVEHHLKGAERLSTYWGYEANAGYVTINDGYGGSDKKMGVGANLLTGFDYYIMPKIYLGAEVSYGVAVTNTNPEWGDDTTSVELAPGITPSLRLGWQF